MVPPAEDLLNCPIAVEQLFETLKNFEDQLQDYRVELYALGLREDPATITQLMYSPKPLGMEISQ